MTCCDSAASMAMFIHGVAIGVRRCLRDLLMPTVLFHAFPGAVLGAHIAASWSVRPCRRMRPATGRRWRLFVYLLNCVEHRFRVDGSGQFFGLSIRSVANEGIVAAEFFHQGDQFCRLLIAEESKLQHQLLAVISKRLRSALYN